MALYGLLDYAMKYSLNKLFKEQLIGIVVFNRCNLLIYDNEFYTSIRL